VAEEPRSGSKRGSFFAKFKKPVDGEEHQPQHQQEEQRRGVSWGEINVTAIDSTEKQMRELAARRKQIEDQMKNSNELVIKVKFPDSFPLAAKRFVLSFEQTVQEACDTIAETIAGRGLAEHGFELGIPRDQRSRPQVAEVLQQMDIGKQIVFLDKQKLVGAYKPLFQLVEYVDFIPPPAFLFVQRNVDNRSSRSLTMQADALLDDMFSDDPGSSSSSMRGGRVPSKSRTTNDETDEDEAADDEFDEERRHAMEQEMRRQNISREQRLQVTSSLSVVLFFFCCVFF
jgi:hypothetical protein